MIDFQTQLQQPLRHHGVLLNITGLAALHWDSRHGDQLLITSQLDNSVAARNTQAAGTAALADGGWHHVAVNVSQRTLSTEAAVARRFHAYNGAVNTRALVLELFVDARVAAVLYVELRPGAAAQPVTVSELAFGGEIGCSIDHVRVWNEQRTDVREVTTRATTAEDVGALASFVTFNRGSGGALSSHLVDITGQAAVSVSHRDPGTPLRSRLVRSGASFGAAPPLPVSRESAGPLASGPTR